MSTQPPSTVRTRQVFYISGFDRRGPAFYHQLYATEATRQAPVNGWHYEVGQPAADGPHAVTWQVTAHHAVEPVVETRYTYLRWEGLVEAYWPASTWRAVWRLPGFYALYTRSGGFKRLWTHGPRFMGMMLAPGVLGVLALALMALVGGLAAAIGWALVGRGGGEGQLAGWVGVVAGLTGASGVGWLAWRWFRRKRLFWLARGWHFLRCWGEALDPAIDAKWSALGDELLAQLARHEADEYLVVAHCGGTPAAVAVLAHLLERYNRCDPVLRARLGRTRLLTLAQMIPMMSFFPGATRLRQQVAAVAAGPVAWYDLSAPTDPLCCGLSDPTVGASDGASVPPRPQVRSARFDRMVDATEYKAMCSDPFRIHFQYLMSTRKPVFNDYFSLTAGPLSLPDRWTLPT